MRKITEAQKEKIFEATNEMTSKIESAMKEVEDTQKVLNQLCEDEELDTYYTWTIEERLKEAKIRLEMAQIRINEFRDEAKEMKLSEGGFY